MPRKHTQLTNHLAARTGTRGYDGEIQREQVIVPSGNVHLTSMDAIISKKMPFDWTTLSEYLNQTTGEYLLLDTSAFDETTPIAFWDQLSRQTPTPYISRSVSDELIPWLKGHPNAYVSKLLASKTLRFDLINEFPGYDKITYRYYVTLLAERSLLLSRWAAGIRLSTGAPPSPEELAEQKMFVEKHLGPRALRIALKHYSDSLVAGPMPPRFYTDQSLAYIAVATSILTGCSITVLTKDYDIPDHLYKLYFLMHTHYVSMLFAAHYQSELLGYNSTTTNLDLSKWGHLLDDSSVTFIDRKGLNPNSLYPDHGRAAVVKCITMGSALTYSAFCFDTNMSELFRVKRATGGLNAIWSGAKNVHLWPHPIGIESPYAIAGAITLDKRRPTPWPPLAISEIDILHTIADCERFQIVMN